MQLQELEPLFKIFYTLSVKISIPANDNFPEKIADKYQWICGKSKASVWTNVSPGTAPKIF